MPPSRPKEKIFQTSHNIRAPETSSDAWNRHPPRTR
jgi:hypothetical protein